MASLRQRAGGWDLRYRDLAGRQRTEWFEAEPGRRRPPEEAVDRKSEVERELRRGTYLTREERQVTFGDYFEKWWSARQVAATRIHTDRQRANKHVLPVWKNWRLVDIRPSYVDDWVGALSKQMGPDSVRHCYTLLRGPVRRTVMDGIITDPLIDINLPAKKKVAKNFDDVLTGTEVRRLVEAMDDPAPRYAALHTNSRYQAMILTGCWLGPRWNEVLGVRVCDVNPLRQEIVFGRVVVNENVTTFIEVGNKTEEHRTVPVPATVIDALVAHAGLTIFDVQRRLGHHSPVLTQEIYTHLMRERYDEGRKTMEDYIHRVMDQ